MEEGQQRKRKLTASMDDPSVMHRSEAKSEGRRSCVWIGFATSSRNRAVKDQIGKVKRLRARASPDDCSPRF